MRALAALTFALLLVLAGPLTLASSDSRIVSVTIDPLDLVSGGSVSVSVETTPDILSIVALAGPHRVVIPQIQPGWYYGTARVPRIPRIIHGHFHVRFVGTTADGETVDADTIVQLN